jgi:hypothetical protein
MTIRLLKTSLKRLRPNRFFRCTGNIKLVRMAFRHLESSLHRLHQSRFLRRPECRLWVLRAIRFLKHHIRAFVQIAFTMPKIQKMISHCIRHLVTLIYLLQKRRFLKRSEGRLWVLRAIRLFINSLKRQRERHFLRFTRCWKWFFMIHRHLESSLHRLPQSRLFTRAEGIFRFLRSIRLFKT